jgi:hypothetical protein
MRCLLTREERQKEFRPRKSKSYRFPERERLLLRALKRRLPLEAVVGLAK